MSENNEFKSEFESSVTDSEIDEFVEKALTEDGEEITEDMEEPLRVSETLPLVMNRKNDKVVIGTTVIKVYKNRAEFTCEISGSEEAGEAAGLFSSNIVGGISIGAILTPEAASKISDHLNS